MLPERAVPLSAEDPGDGDGTGLLDVPVLPTGDGYGAPCVWPAAYAACSPAILNCFEGFTDPGAAKALYEQMASDMLWLATGRILGVCETTVSPCRSDCQGASALSTFWGRGPGLDITFPRFGTGAGFQRGSNGGGGWTGPWLPALIGGEWFNLTCGSCLGACTCEIDKCFALSLPGPIQSISSIMIDGEELPSTSYRIDNKRTVVRTDGACWPYCQDLVNPTFTITYMKGITVPLAGQAAVARLACELALQACNDDRCELPSNLQQLTRQGITATFEDDWEMRQEGWTGIRSIDDWVAQMVAPRPFSSVRSPDFRAVPR